MKKLVASILLVQFLLTPLVNAGYVAEDLGLDLYSKVDQGSGELKLQLVNKRVREGKMKSRLNDALGTICRDTKGKSSKCLSDKEFTGDEMKAISSGDASVIMKHQKNDVVLSSDDVAEITRRTRELWKALDSETSDEQDRLEKMGVLGIYTDGSLKNSSYDLGADLENIHKVIFSENIPYPGKNNNLGNESFAAYLAVGTTYTLSSLLNPFKSSDSDSNTSSGPRASSNNGNSSSSGATSTNPLADCQNSNLPAFDSGLLSDINSTLSTGSSSWSTATLDDGSDSGSLSGSGSGSGSNNPSSGSSSGGSGSDKEQAFPCFSFFCIKIGIEAGFGYLLGGGKSQSIEGVLDQNLKVTDKYKDASFIACRFTNDYFELCLKNLNLSALAHIGIMVSSLPAPILNVSPGKTPRGSGPSDEEREFEEVQNGVLKDFGLNPIRENDIDNGFTNYKINSSAGLSTDEMSQKRDAIEIPKTYIPTKESEITSRFAEGFSSDLLQLSAFSTTFHDYVEWLVSLSKKFNDIPQGGK